MNGQTLVARVAVAAAVYSIDRPYDYSVPSVWRDDLREGQRVIVPFGAGNRKTEGIVLELAEAEAPRQLKALAHVFDDDIVLTPEQKGLALWMCRRYFCTFFQAANALFPPRRVEPQSRNLHGGRSPARRSVRQKANRL
jgi:primosomal protein N' (replication factor Y)